MMEIIIIDPGRGNNLAEEAWRRRRRRRTTCLSSKAPPDLDEGANNHGDRDEHDDQSLGDLISKNNHHQNH